MTDHDEIVEAIPDRFFMTCAGKIDDLTKAEALDEMINWAQGAEHATEGSNGTSGISDAINFD